MRVIQSTLGPAELAEDEGDELVRLIDLAAQMRYRVLRESYCTDSIGQKEHHQALIEYIVPDGGTRFALLSHDPNNIEYSDSADRAAAEAAYEVVVRSLADCASPGEAWWEHTDVAGVPERDENEEED